MSSRIRSDLKFTQLEIGQDGTWVYRIDDPISQQFYKINQKAFEIIKYFSVAKSIPDLTDSLAENRIPGTQEEIFSVISFLKSNNLIFSESSEQKKVGLGTKVIKSYLYFKIPLCRPDSFLEDTKFIGKIIFNKLLVPILTIVSLIGFLLLFKVHENFMEGLSTSLTASSLKYFIISLIVIKLLHELSHVYMAKILGSNVRALGIAFIFLTPRFYSDVSDIQVLSRLSRIKIAIAGIWTEFVIAGLACFFFISTPLQSTVSQLSISFITISLISSLLFNGNPFMRFDGYYVLKEILKVDNLYSNSMLAVKNSWRKLVFGLKPQIVITKTLIIYGSLSLIYRIFLYTSIVVLVYHFFIPAVGILLAVIEAWIFLVKPLINELTFLINSRKSVSLINKAFALILLSGFVYLFFIPISIPTTNTALYGSKQTMIRAEIDGVISDVKPDKITLTNEDLEYSIKSLENDLNFLKLRKRQMLADSKYALLHILKNMEERVKLSLAQEIDKAKKLTIKLPPNFESINKNQNLVGTYLNPGDSVGFTQSGKKLYVYFESSEKEESDKGEIYLSKSLYGVKCKKIEGSKENIKYIPAALSSIHNGPIFTDTSYRPITPVYRVQYQMEKPMPNFNISCTFVSFRKATLISELKSIFTKFLHSEFF